MSALSNSGSQHPSKTSNPRCIQPSVTPERSTGEAVTEHWQTALRLRASRLILENVPVFGQHPVGNTHDVGGDPVSWESNARESPVDDDKVAFGHDQARLIFEGCGRGLDEVEETFAAGFDVRAVLDVLIGPEAGCSIVVTFVEQRVECFEHEGLVLLGCGPNHVSFLTFFGGIAI